MYPTTTTMEKAMLSGSRPAIALSTVPTRICVSGDALDWLGDGYIVSAAIDLSTSLTEIESTQWPDYEFRALTEDLELFTRNRFPGFEVVPARLGAYCMAPSPGGLGTSSSICIALLREILRRNGGDPSAAVRLAYEYELSITRGGGVDHLAIEQGRWTLARAGDDPFPTLVDRTIEPSWAVTLIYSGIEKHCAAGIERLRAQQQLFPAKMRQYTAAYSEISHEAWEAISSKSLTRIQQVLDAAHVLMRDTWDLTTPSIERVRNAATAASGLPFKLTGSGRGGCLFTIHKPESGDRVRKALLGCGIPSTAFYQCNIADGISPQ
jgi:mevalonate kinase